MFAWRSWESLTSERFPKRASVSSKNSTQFAFFASVNTRRRFFSVSPMYLLMTEARSMR